MRTKGGFPAGVILTASPVFGVGVGLTALDQRIGVAAGAAAAVIGAAGLVVRAKRSAPRPPATASEIALRLRIAQAPPTRS